MIEIESKHHSISIESQGITVFFGPTGVGKTTLLRQIAGHIPLEGVLTIDNQVIDSPGDSTRPQDRGFAYVSQASSLIKQFSVRRNLQLAINAARKPLSDSTINDIYGICCIEHLLNRHASQISGGEAQQVCLAMGLLSQPRLMLLDEPLSALDRGLKYKVLSQFERWVKALIIPVIYVSHDVNEIALIAQQMAIISIDKPVQVRPYQAWLADVNSEFVTDCLAVNTLVGRYLRTEHGLNLMTMDGTENSHIWVQGDIAHEQDYVVELPITDISISLHRMQTSSILNQLEARIEAISDAMNGYQFISLKIANQIVTARLTQYSVQHLSLVAGDLCFMCFKTPRVMTVTE